MGPVVDGRRRKVPTEPVSWAAGESSGNFTDGANIVQSADIARESIRGHMGGVMRRCERSSRGVESMLVD